MPYTSTQPALPWNGRSPMARHCSYRSAVSAGTTRASKTRRYLDLLQWVGWATDHEMAEALHLPLSSICSIRNGCGERVTVAGTCTGPFGKRVTRWAAR